jgi:hypothetical protein
MSDSEDKKGSQALPIVPPEGTSLVIIRNKDGSVRESLRNEKGTFVKKPRPLIPTIEFTRSERKKLNTVRSDKDGLTEYMVAFMNIVRIAQNEDNDPKSMMAAVKAFEVLRTSALGKPASSEQDLDRITTQPVKTIIVMSPELMNPKVVDADQAVAKPKQPSFAEVIGVVTNEK